MVRAVLFHTNELSMFSGTVRFYVDGVECPDTGDVGINARGGVFNCNLSGWTFKAVCDEICNPSMHVMEIGIWSETALTVDA